MGEINHGGPAFPNFFATGDVPRGMTLRQAYAMSAMRGIVSVHISLPTPPLPDNTTVFEVWAATAFRIADKMIAFEEAERNESPDRPRVDTTTGIMNAGGGGQ